MGTRADFYIAREDGLEWCGSIAWDGYPEGIDQNVLTSDTPDEFTAALEGFFADNRDDVTRPEMGWPWPWNTSATTDYAYVLIDGEGVVFSSFGGDPYYGNRFDETGDFLRAPVALALPDMSSRKAVAGGSRSGLIVVSA
jgi:hypothetical protein